MNFRVLFTTIFFKIQKSESLNFIEFIEKLISHDEKNTQIHL
jgi:hypothetical protein